MTEAVDAGEAPPGTCTTWHVEKCPFAEECTTKAFARAYVKSQRSEEHCRRILWSHLTVSGHHEQRTKEDIYHVARGWPVEETEGTNAWTKPDQRFPDETIPTPDQDIDERELIRAHRACREEGNTRPKPRQRALGGGPEADVAAMVQEAVNAAFTANQYALAPARQGIPNVCAEALKGALMATHRASAAVEHARDWFLRGHEAFEMEAKTLRDARKTLEAALKATNIPDPARGKKRPRSPSTSPPPRTDLKRLQYQHSTGGQVVRAASSKARCSVPPGNRGSRSPRSPTKPVRRR